MKTISWIYLLLFIYSCQSVEDSNPLYEYEISIGGVLEQNGRKYQIIKIVLE
jgi:hypothetical protein